MNITEITEQVITGILSILKQYPLISIIIVSLLVFLVFLASIELGEHIGDAIWR